MLHYTVAALLVAYLLSFRHCTDANPEPDHRLIPAAPLPYSPYFAFPYGYYPAPLTYYTPASTYIASSATPIIAARSATPTTAAYGHTEPLQAHNAVQDAAGNKIGSYSYISPGGHLFSTNYVADAHGYRVLSNALPLAPAAPAAAAAAPQPLPVAPQDTPEVMAARMAHLRAHHEHIFGKDYASSIADAKPADANPAASAAPAKAPEAEKEKSAAPKIRQRRDLRTIYAPTLDSYVISEPYVPAISTRYASGNTIYHYPTATALTAQPFVYSYL